MTSTKISEAVRVPEFGPPRETPNPQLPAVAETPRELARVLAAATPRVYPPKIAASILAITREVGHVEKRGQHDFHKFKYATWEDVIEALSPLLAEHGLICIQAEKSRHLIEDNEKGSTLSVVYEFSFINDRGEIWPAVEWTALARLRDQKGITDDKAAVKCHSQAEKFFLMKQFKIRTEDETPDADLPKRDVRPHYEKLCKEIMACASADAMKAWSEAEKGRIALLPRSWREMLRVSYGEKLAEFKGGPKARPPGEVAADEWGDRQGDGLRKAMGSHDDETGEVLWEDVPPADTIAKQPTKWADMTLVQQAGIRCGEPLFWKFLQEEKLAKQATNAEKAADFVRECCGIKSRAELEPGTKGAEFWQKLDAAFVAWKYEGN